MEVQVNYLAVLLAGVASMVVGAVWYAMPVFGKKWSELAKVDVNSGKNFGVIMTLTFLLSLLTAYVLAHLSYLSNSFFGNSFLQDSLTTAFWVWLAFTAARFVTHDMFEGRPTMLTVLNLANELVTLLVMALVIGLMGV